MNIYPQLIRDEGFRPRPYRDHLGHWTVGYGYSLETGPPLSEETARVILNEHVGMIVADLHSRLPWTKQLSEPRFGVLISMAYQMGIFGLMSFKNTLRFLEAGDHERTAEAMLDSRWAFQTPERAQRLAQQMREDNWK